jgi:6-phosphofructokinase
MQIGSDSAAGPAPGINGVIASATIEAANRGLRVLGLLDGYRWLLQGDSSAVLSSGHCQFAKGCGSVAHELDARDGTVGLGR